MCIRCFAMNLGNVPVHAVLPAEFHGTSPERALQLLLAAVLVAHVPNETQLVRLHFFAQMAFECLLHACCVRHGVMVHYFIHTFENVFASRTLEIIVLALVAVLRSHCAYIGQRSYPPMYCFHVFFQGDFIIVNLRTNRVRTHKFVAMTVHCVRVPLKWIFRGQRFSTQVACEWDFESGIMVIRLMKQHWLFVFERLSARAPSTFHWKITNAAFVNRFLFPFSRTFAGSPTTLWRMIRFLGLFRFWIGYCDAIGCLVLMRWIVVGYFPHGAAFTGRIIGWFWWDFVRNIWQADGFHIDICFNVIVNLFVFHWNSYFAQQKTDVPRRARFVETEKVFHFFVALLTYFGGFVVFSDLKSWHII